MGAFATNFYDADVYGVNFGLVGALVVEVVILLLVMWLKRFYGRLSIKFFQKDHF